MDRYKNAWLNMTPEEKEQVINLILEGIKNKLLKSKGLQIKNNKNIYEIKNGRGTTLFRTVQSETIEFEVGY